MTAATAYYSDASAANGAVPANNAPQTNGKGDSSLKRFSTEPMDSEKMLSEMDPEYVTTLRFLINKDNAGRIIGKGGETVKLLREKFDCKVQIPDSGTIERVLSVTGNAGQIFDCVEDILARVQKQPNNADKPVSFEIKLLVHSSQAGAIIGNAGHRIKQLRTENNCQVRCFPQVCPQSTDRIVRIAGDQKDAIRVLKLSFVLCLSSPPRGTAMEYNAAFYNPAIVSEYGGIGSEFAASRSQSNSMPMMQPGSLPYGAGHAQNSFNQSQQMYPPATPGYGNQNRMSVHPMGTPQQPQPMGQMGYPGQPQQYGQQAYQQPAAQNMNPYAQQSYQQAYGSGQQQQQSPWTSNNQASMMPQQQQQQQPQTPGQNSSYGYLNTSNPSAAQPNPYTTNQQAAQGAYASQQQPSTSYGQVGAAQYGAQANSYANYAQKYNGKQATGVQKAKNQP